MRPFDEALSRSREKHLSARVGALVQHAQEQGLALDCLGTAPLFERPRVYFGEEKDWTVGPLEDDPLWRRDELFIPADQLAYLRRLDRAGVDFTTFYVAHEVRCEADHSIRIDGHVELTPDALDSIIAPPPPPKTIVERSTRLGEITSTVYMGLGALALATGIGIGVAAVAVPVALLATLQVDPVLFGVVTADDSTRVGEPAAFFALAQWSW